MQDLAVEVAGQVESGFAIGLKGTLGAGKSFFAASFINALMDEKVDVLSPTFNLVCDYNTTKGPVFHFDLYRLKNVEELENIGFFAALKDGICLIEWPEIAETFFKKNYWQINIEIIGEEKRMVTIVR